MTKPSFHNLALPLAVALLIVGVGYTGLIAWSGRPWTATEDRIVHINESVARNMNRIEQDIDELSEEGDVIIERLCERIGLSASKVVPLNFYQTEYTEILLICQQPFHPPNRGFGYVYVIDLANNNQILWEHDITKNPFLMDAGEPRVIDVDGDGTHELSWGGSSWGGTCTGYSDSLILYSPKHDEQFYASEIGWYDQTCTNLDWSIMFSPNLEREQYQIFRSYLMDRLSHSGRQ